MNIASLLLLLGALAADPSISVNGAKGDWPQWRGTPQHTAYQSMPGRIRRPLATKVYTLGGIVADSQLVIAPPSGKCADEVLVLSVGGSLRARCLSGNEIWSRRYLANAQLWGIIDLDQDGRPEVLATSTSNGKTRLEIVDIATGASLWSTDAEVAGAGEIAIGDADGDGHPDLIWGPASSSIVRAYSFAGGYANASIMWQTQFSSYVSDPYGAAPIVIGKAEPGIGADVIISGGRHEFDIIVMRGLNGEVVAHRQYVSDPTGVQLTEGGGEGQLVALRDVDDHDANEIVIVSSYPSSDSYNFQGAIVARPEELYSAIVADNHPYGWEFVDGSLRKLSPESSFSLIVSSFHFARSEFETTIVDAKTLTPKVSVADARLKAIVDTAGGPVAVVQTGNTTEALHTDYPLVAYAITDDGFDLLPWTTVGWDVVTTRRATTRAADVANPGAQAVTIENGGHMDLLLKKHEAVSDTIAALDVLTGEEHARYRANALIEFVRPIGDHAEHGVLVALNGGTIVRLDSALKEVSSFNAGGYYRTDAGNGHDYATAIVADLDGNGINEIYVGDAYGNLEKVDAATAEATFVWHGTTTQDPVASAKSLILRSCVDDAAEVCRFDSQGTLLSRIAMPYSEAHVPIGPNVGRFGPNGTPGLIVAGPPLYPMTTYAFSLDGELLWSAANGPYWDATYAVADFNGDGVDDVVYNYNTDKGRVLDGVDGSLLSRSVTLPTYRQFNFIDYNGAPVIVKIGSQPMIVDVEDNAHLALLRPQLGGDDPHTEIVWTVEQEVLDDERMQMPAAAPVGGGVVLGCGTNHGVFIGRDAATGAALWERRLIAADSTTGTSLTKSIALDVDGDGRNDFIVGGDDGVLHALDAGTGREIWSISLGAPLGEPIAADVYGDGTSEVIVSAADGGLYVVGDGSRRRAVAH